MVPDGFVALAKALLGQAYALRAVFPDAELLGEMPVSDVPPNGAVPAAAAACLAALRCLRDEMLLVRSGRTMELGVLDDEIAGVERELAGI